MFVCILNNNICCEFEYILVLHPRKEELEEPIIRDFMETNELHYYVEDRGKSLCNMR